MKFDIPFIKEIYIEQSKLKFDLIWKKIVKKNNHTLIVGIISIAMGSLVMIGKNNIGIIFIIMGAFFLLQFYKIRTVFLKAKNRYFSAVETEAKNQIEAEQNSIWEFTDEYFRYKDYKVDYKTNWSVFKSFRIINDNLFLDINAENSSSYIVSKKEIGEENFESLVSLVEQKIKKTSSH